MGSRGSWILKFLLSVRSRGSWVLKSCNSVGSCGSWILIFGLGTSLVAGVPARAVVCCGVPARSPLSGAGRCSDDGTLFFSESPSPLAVAAGRTMLPSLCVATAHAHPRLTAGRRSGHSRPSTNVYGVNRTHSPPALCLRDSISHLSSQRRRRSSLLGGAVFASPSMRRRRRRRACVLIALSRSHHKGRAPGGFPKRLCAIVVAVAGRESRA